MLDMKRIGYGFEDDPAQFTDCHAVYIDTPKTERTARRDLFADGVLREGDTLVVLRLSALGRGFDLQKFRGILAEMGVTLAAEPVEPDARPPGPAPAFTPDADLEAAVRPLYHDRLYTLAHVQQRIKLRTGQDVDRHQLRRAWGSRGAGSRAAE